MKENTKNPETTARVAILREWKEINPKKPVFAQLAVSWYDLYIVVSNEFLSVHQMYSNKGQQTQNISHWTNLICAINWYKYQWVEELAFIGLHH